MIFPTPFTTLGEPINPLENHYRGPYDRGYVAATLDAKDAAEGSIDVVINRLAEIIKDVKREDYNIRDSAIIGLVPV